MKIDIPISFAGQTVTIIGGGPSLKGFDFKRVVDPCIAINDACYAHHSEIIVSIDASWHYKHGTYLNAYDGFLVTDRESRRKDAIRIQYHGGARGENEFDETLKAANLSGFLALAISLHLGAKKVVLLGYDGGYAEDANWYTNPNATNDEGYSNKNAYYDIFKGHDIVNVGMDSKIKSFRKIPIESNFYE